MNKFKNSFALVVCGGNSSRMGTDKSMLQYYEKPQRYHVYDMLQPFCERIFISCNKQQTATIESGYDFIEDDKEFKNIGPMAALLSASKLFPQKNMLLIGCDYPFLTAAELQQFSLQCKDSQAAFYNETANVYEPLLAWYPASLYKPLYAMFEAKLFSLQHFLQDNHAIKYYPVNKNVIISIDTPEAFNKAIAHSGA